MKKNYKIILKSKNNNYLITIAIGEKYYESWKKYCCSTWVEYCKKHSLGLIVFTDHLISKKNKFWKKPTWQKFLIGSFVKKSLHKLEIKNICYLDTDILINPYAPNIFDSCNRKKIAVVSVRTGLPYPFLEVRKKIAFLRKFFYSKKYPLDSSLFISLKNLYKFHDLRVQKNEACAGLFVFNVKLHSQKFHDWFFKNKNKIKSITNGGDQTHFNFHVQNEKLDHWIDYKFQASWNYEMAWNYPYLYEKKMCTNINKKKAIEATLYNNYFLHFAGSWPESKMWKTKNILNDKKILKNYKFYFSYLKKKVFGKPKGQVSL